MIERQTIAGAYSRIESHEDRCLIQYTAMHSVMQEMKDDLKWIKRSMFAAVLGFAAWSGAQLWHTIQPPALAATPAVHASK